MEQRALGRSGLVVSRLGLGTATWGKDTDEDDAAAQLVAFREAGGTLLDVSPEYVGEAETVAARLLRDVVPREEVIVCAKAGGPLGLGPMNRGASRAHLIRALDTSLSRMRLDYVDLWHWHTWDAAVPLEESLAALDLAVSSGRVRYAGVSNLSGWQTAAAATWQRAWPGRTPITATQVEYSLVERSAEAELLPACEHLGVGVLAWSPLGRGVLTGKYIDGTPADSRGASPAMAPYVEVRRNGRSARIVAAVLTAADGLGTSPLAVALAWVRDRPGVASALVGARDAAQLAASLAAEPITLPVEITAALDDVSTEIDAPPPLG
jgi:aryl-alcohol dehydrogenase-like predicted oxidoreductase